MYADRNVDGISWLELEAGSRRRETAASDQVVKSQSDIFLPLINVSPHQGGKQAS